MAIWRGTGGSGNSNNEAAVSEVAEYAAEAAASASQAASSEASVAADAAAAAASETNAATSEANAATSETNAATSETSAATSATNAATSATNAATSETSATSSASSASTSATTASNSASAASTSETNAATSASNASTSETNAASSASSASTSATNAATSATAAQTAETAAQAAQAAAEAAQEAIDGLYLGAQASDPTVDLNGDPVTVGDWYFNTTINKSKIYTGSAWDILTSDVASVNAQTGVVVLDLDDVTTAGSTTTNALSTGALTVTGDLLAAKATAGADAFAAGYLAGNTTQGINAVAVGYTAGYTTQGDYAIAVGREAGQTSQGDYAVAYGMKTGETTQGTGAVATGFYAGNSNQGANATAVGREAGRVTQGANSVAVGYDAGETTQGTNAVAVGNSAGNDTQGIYSVATGYAAGSSTQGDYSVAYGPYAGSATQGANAVATGYYAGNSNQGDNAVAVGRVAGQTTQGTFAIAVGSYAGKTTQGAYAVAAGYAAGLTSQGANGVIISATGATLDDTSTGHIHVASSEGELKFTSAGGWEMIDGGVTNLTVSPAGTVTATAFSGDGSSLTGLPAGYTNADVDAHLNKSTASQDQVLTWDGTDYDWIDQSSLTIETNPLDFYNSAGAAPTPYVWNKFNGNLNNDGSSSGSINITSGATPTYATGQDGVSNSAFEYTSGDTLGFSSSPTNNNSDFMWAVWFKQDGSAFGSTSAVIGTGYSNQLIHIGATAPNSTTPSLQIRHTVSGAWQTTVASTQPTWTDWNHYALVKSGNNLYLYLNGLLVASDTLPGTQTYNNDLKLGIYGSGRVTGDFDDLKLYTTIPIQAGVASFSTGNIGGSAVVIGKVKFTGDTTNSAFTVQEYVSGTLTTKSFDPTLQDITDNGATTTAKITVGGLVSNGEVEEQTYSLTGTAIDPANGTMQYKTLAANTTFTSSITEGEYVTLLIDDGSAYTITWPTGMYWPNGVAPTLSTTGWNVIQLWMTNSLLYGSFVSV